MKGSCLGVRRFFASTLLGWLAACGGGGGSGGSESAGGDIGARLSSTTLRVERDMQERRLAAPLTLSLFVDKPPASGYYYRYTHSQLAILFVGSTPRSDAGVDFQVGLSSPGVLPLGTYDDTITIELCLDQACLQPANGSPMSVGVRLVVGHFAPAEADIPPLLVASSFTLQHDLVDAAYSAALDAVVSVSTKPSAALNVHDLSTGLTRSVALSTSPIALSLAPDGLRAAVAHDAAVSVVDLALPSGNAAMPVTRFTVPLPGGRVIFDGRRRVHAFGREEFSLASSMYTLEIATGIATRNDALIYGVAHAVLHPSGDRIYFANRNTSPDDIFAIGLSAGPPGPMVDSPYHGDYPMCSRVWASSSRARLYTACGNTFTSSATRDQDMLYAGAMVLSGLPREYEAVSLAESPSGSEVVLLEQSRSFCDPRLDQLIDCFTHFNTYNASTLVMTSRFSLAPISVGGDRFAQTGRFVFHRINGRVVLLSELRGAPNPAEGVRLSQLP